MAHGLYLIGYLTPSPGEMLLLMLVALLLYGGELPKVARSWGKSLAEFKKGLSGFQNEFNSVLYDEPPRRIPYHDPVYSHNAGTVEGELTDTPVVDDHVVVDEEVDSSVEPASDASTEQTDHEPKALASRSSDAVTQREST
jgi:Sec-independent protein translocase protein TatA